MKNICLVFCLLFSSSLLAGTDLDIDKSDETGKTSLMRAAYKCDITQVDSLIQQGATVDKAHEFHGLTALMYTAKTGCVDVADLLITKGANVNKQDISSCTPLMQAVWKHQIKMAEFLVSKGADVNKVGAGGGMTALMYAAYDGYVDMVIFLTQNGAKLDIKDNYGKTALMFAEGEYENANSEVTMADRQACVDVLTKAMSLDKAEL